MKIPNGEHAVVDIEKLRDYCLSSEHPEGRHKARVFLAVLGINSTHAEKFRSVLVSAATVNDLVSMTFSDMYGCRYSFDFYVTWSSRTALVRTAWIIKANENFPRLVSCYVLRGET